MQDARVTAHNRAQQQPKHPTMVIKKNGMRSARKGIHQQSVVLGSSAYGNK
jgi:hypothetical protein